MPFPLIYDTIARCKGDILLTFSFQTVLHTKKLIRFTIPSVIMLIFTSIYGVVDGIWFAVIAAEGMSLLVVLTFLKKMKPKYKY